MPERIQQQRIKGWRLPLHARSVARPSRYGNPFTVWRNRDWYAETFDESDQCMGYAIKCADHLTARKIATQAFRTAVEDGWHGVPGKARIRADLAGLSLACYCPLPAPGETDWCHAAVLLSIANKDPHMEADA